MTAITTPNSLSAINAQALIDNLPKENQVNLSRIESAIKDTTKDIIQIQGNTQPETNKSKESPPRKYKKAGLLRIIGGFLLGGITAHIVAKPFNYVSKNRTSHLKNISDSCLQQVSVIAEAADKALEDTKLKSAGVKILRISESTSGNKNIHEAIHEEISSGIIGFFPEKIRKGMGELLFSTLRAGYNAFYGEKSNRIFLPKEDFSLAVFHEMGHSHNANKSIIGKSLQKIRPLTLLTLPVGIIAYKPPKAPEQKPKSIFDKYTDKIKNNAGKLIFLLYSPVLIEEGMATFKGNSFAKNVLSEDLYKKTVKFNRKAYWTYLMAATSATLGVVVAAKVSDKITSPKLVKKKTKKLTSAK